MVVNILEWVSNSVIFVDITVSDVADSLPSFYGIELLIYVSIQVPKTIRKKAEALILLPNLFVRCG